MICKMSQDIVIPFCLRRGCSESHHLVVVGDVELDGVNGGLEWPGKLMLPHGFHDDVLKDEIKHVLLFPQVNSMFTFRKTSWLVDLPGL